MRWIILSLVVIAASGFVILRSSDNGLSENLLLVVNFLAIAWFGAMIFRRFNSLVLLPFMVTVVAVFAIDILFFSVLDFFSLVELEAIRIRIFAFALIFWVYGLVGVLGAWVASVGWTRKHTL